MKKVREQNRSGSDAIFTIPRRTVQKEHKRACEDAGIDDYTIHDHRHTAAVALARAGVPLQNLQGQLGHANITQTMKYALFHPEYSDLRRVRWHEHGSVGLMPSGRTRHH